MSKSTSISDLPKNESQNDADIQESMMVNSILKDIENDDEPLSMLIRILYNIQCRYFTGSSFKNWERITMLKQYKKQQRPHFNDFPMVMI